VLRIGIRDREKNRDRDRIGIRDRKKEFE